jgi:nucleotide-binding universal stress UspA family protein
METKILIPITLEDVNKVVILRADQWGQRTGAELRFLYVRRPIDQSDGEFSLGGMTANTEKKKMQDYEDAHAFIEKLDIQSKYSISIRMGAVGSQINSEEKSYKPDLIIFGALNDNLIARLFLDSKTDYSIHHSNCSIFVYKSTMQLENNQILVPVDYSDINRHTIAVVDAWAVRIRSHVTFLHVAPVPENAKFSGQFVWVEEQNDDEGEKRSQNRVRNVSLEERQRLESFLASLKLKSQHEFMVKFGEVNVKILEVQNKLDANLLALSTKAQIDSDHAYIGSNTDYLLNYTDCSIFLYKEWEK